VAVEDSGLALIVRDDKAPDAELARAEWNKGIIWSLKDHLLAPCKKESLSLPCCKICCLHRRDIARYTKGVGYCRLQRKIPTEDSEQIIKWTVVCKNKNGIKGRGRIGRDRINTQQQGYAIRERSEHYSGFQVTVRHKPQCANQLKASVAVTVAKACGMTLSSASRVRAWAFRKHVLTFPQQGSIGDRSGE
jgi:hypothetical protein